MLLLSAFKKFFAALLGATMVIHDDDVDVPRDKTSVDDVDVSRDNSRDADVAVSQTWADSEEVVRLPEHFIQRPAKW